MGLTLTLQEENGITRQINLGQVFIDGAMERPRKPRHGLNRWKRSSDGQLFGRWNSLSVKEKYRLKLKPMADDLRCRIISIT